MSAKIEATYQDSFLTRDEAMAYMSSHLPVDDDVEFGVHLSGNDRLSRLPLADPHGEPAKRFRVTVTVTRDLEEDS